MTKTITTMLAVTNIATVVPTFPESLVTYSASASPVVIISWSSVSSSRSMIASPG
jgi:hypothetical protein